MVVVVVVLVLLLLLLLLLLFRIKRTWFCSSEFPVQKLFDSPFLLDSLNIFCLHLQNN